MDVPRWVEKHRAGEPLTVDDIADAIESIFDAFDRLIERLDQEKAHNMGAFDEIENITVPDDSDPEGAAAFRKKWKWDAHEQVTMRGAFTAADHEAVQNANSPSAQAQQGRKVQEVGARMGTGQLKLLERMIVSWTLTASGRPVAVSPQAIRRLPSNYLVPLLERCDELAVAMTEEEQDNFLPSGSAPTSVK